MMFLSDCKIIVIITNKENTKDLLDLLDMYSKVIQFNNISEGHITIVNNLKDAKRIKRQLKHKTENLRFFDYTVQDNVEKLTEFTDKRKIISKFTENFKHGVTKSKFDLLAIA